MSSLNERLDYQRHTLNTKLQSNINGRLYESISMRFMWYMIHQIMHIQISTQVLYNICNYKCLAGFTHVVNRFAFTKYKQWKFSSIYRLNIVSWKRNMYSVQFVHYNCFLVSQTSFNFVKYTYPTEYTTISSYAFW